MKDEINKDELGKRIKKIRSNLGQTAEVFGQNFDPPANRSLVSSWENGRYVPGPSRVKKIAKLADISVNELLYGRGYAVEYPVEYHFIKKNLNEAYLSFKNHEQIAKKLDKKNIDYEVESYLLIYANDFSTSPLFKQAIDTKDNSLFKSLLKNDIEEKLFFSDEKYGYIREVVYNLYKLSDLLGNIRGTYEQEHDKLPPYSERISEILNRALSEIVELLGEEETTKTLNKIHDYDLNLESDFNIFDYQEEE